MFRGINISERGVMKKIKRMMAIAIAIISSQIIMGSTFVFSDNSTPNITIAPANTGEDTKELAINYKYYQILEASIGKDPVVNPDGTTKTEGEAAYYVTTEDRATQLNITGLFNVTKVDGQNKWFVDLKDSATTADQIVAAFSASDFDKSKFPTGTFDKAVGETNAQSGDLAAGYYYIESSLGTKIALQTLTAVTINEKNSTGHETDKRQRK